jgi:protein-disulfide isomerase
MSSLTEGVGPEDVGPENEGAQAGRQRQIVLLVVIVVVVLAVLLIVVTQSQSRAPATLDPTALAAGGGTYAGIPHGQAEDGMFRLGAPDAPIELREFLSFGCGHCANFHDTTFRELVASEIKNGDVNFVIVPYTDPSSQALIFASATAYCAGEQGRFWEMNDLLFGWLEQYGGSAYQTDRVLAAIQDLGMDADNFQSCLQADSTVAWLNNANSQFISLGQQYQNDPAQVTGTPTITINGVPPITAPDSRSGDIPIDMLRDMIAAAS